MIGLELRQRVAPIVGQLLARGLNLLPAGPNVLRLLPPLIIARQDLDTGLDLIIATLHDAHAEAGA
jgi:4-aminobutyrate aminotransferase-like enzyme